MEGKYKPGDRVVMVNLSWIYEEEHGFKEGHIYEVIEYSQDSRRGGQWYVYFKSPYYGIITSMYEHRVRPVTPLDEALA